MTWLYLIFGLVLVMVAATAYWYFVRWQRAQSAAEILSDPNPVAAWSYTPVEWQQLMSEFTWADAVSDSAQVRICQRGFYIGSASQSRVYELETGDKVVTFAGYLATEGNPLKLRVRWKTVTYDENNYPQVKYHKEDYRIPVPLREKEEALKVVDFFTARLDNNLAAYSALVPDDEPISLFGKDSF